MPYFKNSDDRLFYFDVVPDELPGDFVAITDEEFAAIPAPAAPVPQVVSMRQARLALLGAGILSSVDTAIAALPSPQKEAAQIEWDYASEVRRDNPLIASMATALNLTSQQVDALFTTAAGL